MGEAAGLGGYRSAYALSSARGHHTGTGFNRKRGTSNLAAQVLPLVPSHPLVLSPSSHSDSLAKHPLHKKGPHMLGNYAGSIFMVVFFVVGRCVIPLYSSNSSFFFLN